jgi:hypothetical protein
MRSASLPILVVCHLSLWASRNISRFSYFIRNLSCPFRPLSSHSNLSRELLGLPMPVCSCVKGRTSLCLLSAIGAVQFFAFSNLHHPLTYTPSPLALVLALASVRGHQTHPPILILQHTPQPSYPPRPSPTGCSTEHTCLRGSSAPCHHIPHHSCPAASYRPYHTAPACCTCLCPSYPTFRPGHWAWAFHLVPPAFRLIVTAL